VNELTKWAPEGREALRKALQEAKDKAARESTDVRCALCGMAEADVKMEWATFGAHKCVRLGGSR
jgi:ssDNA-binding Zn-finger/Zn-ribbon topoisomerase 1